MAAINATHRPYPRPPRLLREELLGGRPKPHPRPRLFALVRSVARLPCPSRGFLVYVHSNIRSYRSGVVWCKSIRAAALSCPRELLRHSFLVLKARVFLYKLVVVGVVLSSRERQRKYRRKEGRRHEGRPKWATLERGRHSQRRKEGDIRRLRLTNQISQTALYKPQYG